MTWLLEKLRRAQTTPAPVALHQTAGSKEPVASHRPEVPNQADGPADLEHQARERLVAPWDEDQRERFIERAGIMEYDGGLDRDDAERRAFEAHASPLDRAALLVARFLQGRVIGPVQGILDDDEAEAAA